jgi:hypothetical protein
MAKRQNANQMIRLLREADRDLAKTLIVADVCRKPLGRTPLTRSRFR